MKHKVLQHSHGLRTHALIFDQEDDVLPVLEGFSREQRIRSASFTAIGAFREAVLGWFDWETRDYRRIEMREQVEVLSLLGDISLEGQRHKVHAHVVLGARDGLAHGGHLLQARVRPTLEMFLRETNEELCRAFDPLSRIPLIALP